MEEPEYLGEFVAEQRISIGNANLKISIDDYSVDEFIIRLERAIAAFKAEWNRR